jgi:predicted RNA methylase
MKIKTVQIDSDVEAVLRNAKIEGDKLGLQGQLDRALYVKTNKILELIGFRWDRKAKCHVGQGDSAEKLKAALNAGACVDEKKTYQFYETPFKLAEDLAWMAKIKPGQSVLEPSAGKGAIVSAILKVYPFLSQIDVCEIQPELQLALKEMSKTRLMPADDFLDLEEKYDRIIMNPPFTAGQDVAHVKHAYDLLRPGGRLVAITSKSWKSHSSKKIGEFREWHEALVKDGLAEEPRVLPSGTFSQSGTEVETLVLVLDRPH